MLQIILICSLFSYGMFTLQRPGFLLHRLSSFWKIFPKYLHEPLFSCGICVASLWGGGCYFYLLWVERNFAEHQYTIYWLPIVLISAVGINSLLDRGIKAFEKHYGYTQAVKKKGEAKWDYLLPYCEIRTMLIKQLINEMFAKEQLVIEIGGFHPEWEKHELYLHYDYKNRIDADTIQNIIFLMKQQDRKYSIIIMGLRYNGDLEALKKLIRHSVKTVIEYNDDGISRQQVEYLTKDIPTHVFIPEYSINSNEKPPEECGEIGSRKIIILQP